jgi:mRNA interferase YafQ
MRSPAFTNQFEKDLRRMLRRNKDVEKIKDVISILVAEEPLSERYRDHALVGNHKGRRECHIEPDWLLIYKLTKEEIIFERTGSHADLFK